MQANILTQYKRILSLNEFCDLAFCDSFLQRMFEQLSIHKIEFLSLLHGWVHLPSPSIRHLLYPPFFLHSGVTGVYWSLFQLS